MHVEVMLTSTDVDSVVASTFSYTAVLHSPFQMCLPHYPDSETPETIFLFKHIKLISKQ